MIQTVEVPEDLVHQIQIKDAEVATTEYLLKEIINAHLLDEVTDILEAPVIKKLQQMLVQSKMEYEMQKMRVYETYVKPISTTGVWELNFLSNEVTVSY